MTDIAVGTAALGVQDLLDAGLHFGHQTRRWNPKMRPYIFGKRNGIHIIDLQKTVTQVERAREFLVQVALSGQSVLFVGTKKQAQQVIKEAALRCGQHYVINRWLGGTLTNSQTMRKRVARMRELRRLIDSGEANQLPKKEVAGIRHDLAKLERNLSGVADMGELPGALFIVDVNREAIAIAEAHRLKIPVVAIVDTNCSPDRVDYVIPANDDAIRAIGLIANSLAAGISEAYQQYLKKAADSERKRREEEETRRRASEAAAAQAQPEAIAEGESAAKPARRRTRTARTETAGETTAAAEVASTEPPAPEKTAPTPEPAAE